MDEKILQMLRCPATAQPLVEADPSLIAEVNDRIEAGRLTNRVGETLHEPLDGGLINSDRSLLYPVYDDIPCLIADDAIALDQLASN